MEETDALARGTGARPFAQSTLERLLGHGGGWESGVGRVSTARATPSHGIVQCCFP